MIKQILIHTPLVLLLLFTSFYMGLQTHIPVDLIQQRLQYEVHKSSKELIFLDIEKTSMNGLGLRFSEVYVLQKERKNAEATQVFFSPEIQVHVPLGSLLQAQPQGSISSELFGGQFHTDIALRKNNTIHILPTIQGLNAAFLPSSGSGWELSFLGMMDLTGDIKFPINKFAKAKGKLKLSSQNLQLETGKVLIKELPAMTFSETNIELKLHKGKAEIKEGSIVSDELQIEIGGHIKLHNAPLKSKLYLTVKIETGDQINKLIGTLGKPYQDADGAYNFKVLGRINSPRIQSIGKKPKRRTPKKRTDTDDMDIDEERIKPAGGNNARVEEDSANGDREKKRQERIERARKRRAERLKNRKVGPNPMDRITANPKIISPKEINLETEDDVDNSEEEDEGDNSEEEEPSNEDNDDE